MSGLSSTKQSFQQKTKRRGNLGYGQLKAIRILVYVRLNGLNNGSRIVEHLKKYLQDAKTLGLSNVPNLTSVRAMVETLFEPSRRDFNEHG